MSETVQHPKHDRTLVIIKPDGVQRSLMGEIIQRFERVGLKLVAMKLRTPSREEIEKHYTLDPEWRRRTGENTIKSYKAKGKQPPSEDPFVITDRVLRGLMEYMSSGPAVFMVWQGAHAVPMVRKLVGGTEPLSSDVGTIRGDYVLDSYDMSDGDGRSLRNLIHASGSPKEAEDEIGFWFKENEIVDYTIVQEKILYDVAWSKKE